MFSQCDKDGTGWAIVDDLVEYVRKMLSGNAQAARKDEDVYDSDESVCEIQY